MRAFIGVGLDEPVRGAAAEAVEQIRAGLKSAAKAWSFVRPESYHFTLRFLGNIDEAQQRAIEGLLGQVAGEAAPFSLALRGMGAFPSLLRPRVAWIDVIEGGDALSSLAERIAAGLEPLGFEPEERAFRAHLTIGRAKDPTLAPAIGPLLAAREQLDFGRQEVEAITLFRSELHPSGARYTPVSAHPLVGA